MGIGPSKDKKHRTSTQTDSVNSSISSDSTAFSLPVMNLGDGQVDSILLDRARLKSASSRGRPRSQTFASVIKEGLADMLRAKEEKSGDVPVLRTIRSNSADDGIGRESFSSQTGNFGILSDNMASQMKYNDYEMIQKHHYLLKFARKSNYSAPINNPDRIVQVSSGSGIWTIEMAQKFPDADVIGIDINPPNRGDNFPRNLSYIRGNPLSRLPLEDESVDYIYQCGVALSIPKGKWIDEMREFMRVLKPGGLVELVEDDIAHHDSGPITMRYEERFVSRLAEFGIEWETSGELDQKLKEVGFVDVFKGCLDLPLGEWSDDPNQKEIGFINLQNRKAVFKVWGQWFIEHQGITQKEYEEGLAACIKEFDDYHVSSRTNIYIARKPGLVSEAVPNEVEANDDDDGSDDDDDYHNGDAEDEREASDVEEEEEEEEEDDDDDD